MKKIFLLLIIFSYSCSISKIETKKKSHANHDLYESFRKEENELMSQRKKLEELKNKELETYNKLLELSKEAIIKKREKDIKIIAVGDMMLGTTYPKDYLHEKPEILLKEALGFLKYGDVIFGNLEGPITDNAPLHKKCKNPSSCYAFKSPTKYIKYYQQAGFNFLSMANNHSGDFGLKGRDETRSTLKNANISYSGIIGDKAIRIVNGIKVGMLAFAPNWGCNSINDIPRAISLIKELDKEVDIIIVSFHGGAEGRSKLHVYKEGNEIFLNERRGDLLKFSKSVIDAGADIVIGHGPHVPRAIDIYKNRLIAYSLGNFMTYGRFSLFGESGYAPILYAKLKSNGEFIEGSIYSFYQNKKDGLKFDLDDKAMKLIRELTQEDFPKSKIFINNLGKIKYKK